MRVATIFMLGTLSLGTGCTNSALRNSTVSQANTMTELQYQMVLENLATLAANAGTMPWHANITGGTTQMTDSAQGALGFGINSYYRPKNGFLNISPAVNASRTVVQQWGHSPVTDGDELRLLRIAYRRALGSDEMPSAELLDDLAREIKKQIVATEDLKVESSLFYQEMFSSKNKSYAALDEGTDSTVGDKKFFDSTGDPARAARKTPLAREVASEVNEIIDELKKIHPGWYKVGRKHDVPKNASYVAHYKDVYVWVEPEGVDGLTEFTLSVLEMASTIHPPPPVSLGSGGVNYSPGFDVSF
jgi:hypothetical protein